MGCSGTCRRGNPGHGAVLILDRFPIVQLSTRGLAWLQKKSGLLLILPFAHLCVCFLYLAVYFYIFGYNLSTFADAGDVFSVSFTNIAPFYVSAIFGIGSNATIDFESRETGPDPSNGCLLIGVILPASALTIYLFAVVIAEYFRSGFIVIGVLWIALLLAVLNVNDLVFRKKHRGWKDRVFVAAWLFTSLIITAWAHAQRDLYYDVHELAEGHATCNGNPIINKLGDEYLVVRSDNSRWLVDSKCEFGARITPPPKRTYPQHWQIDLWPF